ncbi:hypothetical protein ACP70R_006805 [Stipagrostis hirtigluma subsp. patula]
MRSVAIEGAMAALPEPGEGPVRYLVNTFERLLLLAAAGGGGGPEAQSRGARRRKKNKATTVASTLTPSPSAEEINVSCPSVASSSDVSFPAIAGVACIPDASYRIRIVLALYIQKVIFG